MKDSELVPPEVGDWIAIGQGLLSADAASTWAARPDCGAIVTFWASCAHTPKGALA
jgi:hypothetical protein